MARLFSSEETISYQTTSEIMETDELIQTAKCYLIRNQNDATSGRLDVHYDTIFGTFLFTERKPVIDLVTLYGLIKDVFKWPLFGVRIELIDAKGDLIQTTKSSSKGFFEITERLAAYTGQKVTLKVGRKRTKIDVNDRLLRKGRLKCDFSNIRAEIDFEEITYQDLAETFGELFQNDMDKINDFSQKLRTCTTEREVIDALGLNREETARFRKRYRILWDSSRIERPPKGTQRPSRPKRRRKHGKKR